MNAFLSLPVTANVTGWLLQVPAALTPPPTQIMEFNLKSQANVNPASSMLIFPQGDLCQQ